MLYHPSWKSMVRANKDPLTYLLRNVSVIHHIETETCPLGGEMDPDLSSPPLNTLMSVVDEATAKLGEVVTLVSGAVAPLQGSTSEWSELGITAAGPEDLVLVSALRDRLQQYLATTIIFQGNILPFFLWLYEIPDFSRPYANMSKNLSPFLCVIWRCTFYDDKEAKVPFPGTSPTDIIAADKAKLTTVDVETSGRDLFQTSIRNFEGLLDGQHEANQELLTWLRANIDNERFDFSSLLPEWWTQLHADSIQSVIDWIDEWVLCWKRGAALDTLVELANAITPIEPYLLINPGKTLVTKPSSGWPWDVDNQGPR
ncbi:hypothetical protein TWF281_005486 [Arthrobotrys megalospora]